MVQLTDEQLRELDRAVGQRLTIVDPRSSTEYVLVPQAEFTRLQQEIAEEMDLHRFLNSAAASLFRTLDEEEEQHGQSW